MSKIGIALAGGGPLGGIYEVGACAALEESIDGLDLTAADVCVGVSAGGFVAAALANALFALTGQRQRELPLRAASRRSGWAALITARP